MAATQGVLDQSCSIHTCSRHHFLEVVKLAGVVLVTAVFVVLFAYGSNAAEVSCLTTWGWMPHNEANLEHDFPSGRRPSRATCTEVLLKGQILSGDFDKVFSLVKANHPFLDRLSLWSPGGSVEEAMKIGRLVRKAMLYTRSPGPPGLNSLLSDSLNQICDGADCNCASACFLIWAAGIERDGGIIGLHRPSTESTSFGNLPSQQASSIYRSLLAEINNYLSEMEVPQSLVEAMTGTSSAGIRWLTSEEYKSLQEVPSVAEWVASSCGVNSLNAAIEKLLAGRNDLRELSLKERAQWEMLVKRAIDRDTEIWDCRDKKIYNSRDAISID